MHTLSKLAAVHASRSSNFKNLSRIKIRTIFMANTLNYIQILKRMQKTTLKKIYTNL